MDSREARRKFKLADELFRDKHYTEALTVLDKLDAEFPGAKNVMYPRALCLMKLGRAKEAHEVCYKLKTIHNDPRADALLQKLASSIPQASPPPLFDPNVLEQGMAFEPMDLSMVPIGSGGADPMGLGDLFAPKPGAAPAVVPPAGPNRKPLYIGLGVVGAVLLVALIALPLLVERSDDTEIGDGGATPTGGATESVPQEIYWYNSHETARNAAYAKRAPLLLFFYNSGSDDASRMLEETWREPSIAHLTQGWICARIDTEVDPQAAQLYEVTEVPTVVVESLLTGPVFKQSGYVGAQDFYNAVEPLGLKAYPLPEVGAGALIVLLLLWVAQAVFGLYLTLLFVRKLPHEEFKSDIVSVGLVGIGVFALATMCPCVGWIAAIIILHKVYEMGIVDFLVLIIVNIAFSFFTTIFAAVALGVPYSQLAEMLLTR